MKRGNNMEPPIPTDLITEIFSRLPGKSVARFRSLSKLWGSTLRSPDFTELFLSRSSTRPRLLLAVERNCEWLFFSSPQPQNPSEKSVTADYHTKFSADVCGYTCSYASGWIYFPAMTISKEEEAAPMVCNPVTGMYQSLPRVQYSRSKGFLGFNPIDKQFKVFDNYEILTVGTGELSWRDNSILCPRRSQSEGICIHGVLYYLSARFRGLITAKIVCFEVMSEEIKFIDAECFYDHPDNTPELVLINYKGKLGVISWKYGEAGGGRRTLELCMWVLEDVETQEWLKHVYTVPENQVLDSCEFFVAGVTARGEIVLCMKYTCKPFYVFYFNPERNTLQSVEIQGFGANLELVENRGAVFAFVDHVDDLSLNDAKQLKSSISQVKHLCSCCNEVAQPKFNYKKA